MHTEVLEFVLAHEGGYVDHPDDPGGATKYGISARQYPELNIKNLTVDQAKAIYKRDYWDVGGYKNLHHVEVATRVFDMAVNAGHKQAVLCLQRALLAAGESEIVVDGILGPQTCALERANPGPVIVAAYRSERAAFYRLITSRNADMNVFLGGWLKRAYA